MKKAATFSIVLSSLAVLASLVILELLGGIIFNHLPEKFHNGKRIVQLYLGEEPTIPARIEPHPYLLYQNTPNYHADGFLQHNSHHYRGREFDVNKAVGTTRILVLGGSTTYMYPYVKNPVDTWVAQLDKLLSVRFDQPLEVINAGLSFATSAELLAGYLFRHQYLSADIVIYHAGINDVSPLMFENYDPEYAHFRGQGQGGAPRRFERSLLRSSRFLRCVYAFWLNPQEAVYKSQPFPFNELDRDRALELVERTESVGFRRNLESFLAYARATGVKVILLGDIQAREEHLSRNRPEFKGLEKAKAIGLAKHHAIMQELAQKWDVPFIKLDQDAFEDDWFKDNCHLNEEGEAQKAALVGKFFIEHREDYFRKFK